MRAAHLLISGWAWLAGVDVDVARPPPAIATLHRRCAFVGRLGHRGLCADPRSRCCRAGCHRTQLSRSNARAGTGERQSSVSQRPFVAGPGSPSSCRDLGLRACAWARVGWNAFLLAQGARPDNGGTTAVVRCLIQAGARFGGATSAARLSLCAI